jgi:cold shock CspA family protein
MCSIMSTQDTETSSPGNFDSATNYTGRVKWFNNKAGYGFVTIVSESDRTGEDVFVHHSGVKVASEQYKYLVQGEYASFTLKESDNEQHPYQADNLTGVYGGKLMCETRAEQRAQREEHGGETDDTRQAGWRGDRENRHQRGQSFRVRGAGPRGDNAVWTLVREDAGAARNHRVGGQRSSRPRTTQSHAQADE